MNFAPAFFALRPAPPRIALACSFPLRLLILIAALVPALAQAQLFDNLEALSNRIKVGTRQTPPKGLAVADFDGDTRKDWAVSRLDGKLVVAFGQGNGKFSSVVEIPSPASALRHLLAADLNGDGRVDLASADPFQGKVYLFFNTGGRSFAPAVILPAWEGARDLAAGDFNGDGIMDLAVAGSDKDVTVNFDQPWSPLPGPPPAIQPKTGVVQYKGTGGGAFQRVGNVPALATASVPFDDEDYVFPRPVYVLKTWRPAGETKDWLVVTHAVATQVWVLAPSSEGLLNVRSEIVTDVSGVRSIALGPVAEPRLSGRTDLVLASRDLGTIEVHRPTADGLGFLAAPHQKLDMPGGPRAVELADLDADGWNELVVVARYFDRVVTFKNTAGQLARSSEAQTGSSPRELATADFDGDNRADFVVLNRDSFNVSVLLAAAAGTPRAGFTALDQLYPVDADIAQLGVHDLNGDGRAEVLQLHRASEEVSIRISGLNGKLGDPTFYKMGTAPSSFSLGDVNRDGKADLVVANLGGPTDGGAVTVRLGNGAGGFGEPQSYRPPLEPPPPTGGGGPEPDPSLPVGALKLLQFGRLYAVLVVDLDGDGIKDLAVGYYDCRIVFFKGDGMGHFTPTRGFSDHELYTEFGYEARFFVAGDFDQDGDMDIAAAAWPGDVVVLENTGNFFGDRANEPFYKRHSFPRYDNTMAQARDIVADDVNGDGDLDLLIGTGSGAQILIGKPGMAFERKLYPKPGGNPNLPVLPVIPKVNFPVGAMVTGDFDGDEDGDMAAMCVDDACLHILTRDADGDFSPALIVDAPKTSYLATGDVDGDGKPDLVGSGSVLWVALSSRRANAAEPLAISSARPAVGAVVINEILANNNTVPVPYMRSGVPVAGLMDAVELFNGSNQPVSLAGGKLRLVTGTDTKEFLFPGGTILGPGGRHVILASNDVTGSPWTTGFNLPKEGGTLSLIGTTIADEVQYPPLSSNQSYARFADGAVSFHVNQLPDPGRPNMDNGVVEPVLSLRGISLAQFQAGGPVRFYAKAKDDVGIVGLILKYRVRGQPDAPFQNALLYDDGLNSDGGRLDGVFSGTLDTAYAAGTELEFYLEGEDLSGAKEYLPGPPPDVAEEGVASTLFTITLPGSISPISGLEISEAVSNNQSGLTDEKNQIEDWIELRNTTNAPLALGGVELAQSLFTSSARFVFPAGFTLGACEYVTIFCDEDKPALNSFHAPFKLSGNDGEEVHLVARSSDGTQRLLDFIQLPPLMPNVAYARAGVGGPFLQGTPTPKKPNAPAGGTLHIIRGASGESESLFTFPGAGHVEGSFDLRNWSTVMPATTDNGIEHSYREPMVSSQRFFRVR